MNLPPKLVRNSFLIAILAVGLYAVGSLWLGFDSIRQHISRVPFPYLMGMAGLSLLNYGLRFLRWEYYLRQCGICLDLKSSLGLYFTAYVMVITPGKIGEVFKAGILREKYGVSLAVGLPVVLAERIYDFLAVLALAGIGLLFWPAPFAGIGTGLLVSAAVPLVLVLLHQSRVRSLLLGQLGKASLLKSHTLALEEAMGSLTRLLGPGPLLLSLLVSILAWLAECLGLWLAARSLGEPLAVLEGVFTYAAGTLVGSLSFLPGGLGGTEATMVYLLQSIGMEASAGATVTLLVRLFTLWLAVLIGLLFFLGYRKVFFRAAAKDESHR